MRTTAVAIVYVWVDGEAQTRKIGESTCAPLPDSLRWQPGSWLTSATILIVVWEAKLGAEEDADIPQIGTKNCQGGTQQYCCSSMSAVSLFRSGCLRSFAHLQFPVLARSAHRCSRRPLLCGCVCVCVMRRCTQETRIRSTHLDRTSRDGHNQHQVIQLPLLRRP